MSGSITQASVEPASAAVRQRDLRVVFMVTVPGEVADRAAVVKEAARVLRYSPFGNSLTESCVRGPSGGVSQPGPAELRHGLSIGPLNRRPDWKGMGNDRACLDGLRGGATHHLHGSAFFVRLGQHAAAMHDERAAAHSAVGRSASRMVRSALEMRVSQSRKGYLSRAIAPVRRI